MRRRSFRRAPAKVPIPLRRSTSHSLSTSLPRLAPLHHGPLGAILAVAALALSLPASAAAQDDVSGRASSEDGRPVGGATVRIFPVADSTRWRITDTDGLGFFAFRDVAPGAYFLSLTRIGYAQYRERIQVTAGARTELEITVASQAIELEGVEVEAERSRSSFEESAGVTVQDISREAMKAIPGLAETDPLRAVEVLPG